MDDFEILLLDLRPYDLNNKNHEVSVALVRNNTKDHDLQSHLAHFLLTPSELKDIESFKSEKRKQEYAVGRYAAKLALEKLSQVNCNNESILRGPLGQPLLSGPMKEQYGVSISHSGSLTIALAFPRAHPFAIDLETTTAKEVPHLQNEQLSVEKSVLENLAIADEKKFLLCWTAKESLAKIIIEHHKLPMGSYKLKDIQKINEQNFIVHFDKFPDYKAQTVFQKQYTLSISMPKEVNLQFAKFE